MLCDRQFVLYECLIYFVNATFLKMMPKVLKNYRIGGDKNIDYTQIQISNLEENNF